MANVRQLIDCFNDTMHRIQTDPFLCSETMKSKADTVVYPVFWDNNQAAYFAKWLYFDSCDVEVVADTTFSAARKYLRNGNVREQVAVLNFANPHYAGGGVEHGAMAQEECLCRSSNLYPCLFAPCAQAEYYQFHRNRPDHHLTFENSDFKQPGFIIVNATAGTQRLHQLYVCLLYAVLRVVRPIPEVQPTSPIQFVSIALAVLHRLLNGDFCRRRVWCLFYHNAS